MKLCEVDKTKLAPMMAHYVELKEHGYNYSLSSW